MAKKGASRLGWILTAALAAMAFSGNAAAINLATAVLDDGMATAFEHPSAAAGPDGSVHIVVQGIPIADFANQTRTSEEIYYIRVSPAGQVLTPLTQVSGTGGSTGNHKSRPQIAVTRDNRAVVTWRDNASTPIYAVVVNSAGGVDVPETQVATGSDNWAIAVDGNNSAHIVANSSSTLVHVRFNAASLVNEVAQHQLGTSGVYYSESNEALAIDGSGNLHVLFMSSDNHNPAYLMADNSGNILIDETPLHSQGGANTPGQFVYIFADGASVYAVYGDKRFTSDAVTFGNIDSQGGSTFYSKLNPTPGTADINRIRVGSEILLGNLWYSRASRSADGTVHVVAGSGTRGSGDLNYVTLQNGKVDSARITATNSAYSQYRKLAAVAGNVVAWTEGAFAPTATGTTLRLMVAFDKDRATTSDDQGLFGCAISAPGTKTPVDPTLPLLAALSALFLARRRVHARH